MKYPDDFINKIIQGDCLKIMKEIPDNSIDLVLTDPPYMISSSLKIRRQRNPIKFTKKWKFKGKDIDYKFGDWDIFETMTDYLNFTEQWFKECIRVLRKGGHIVSFFDKHKLSYLVHWAEKLNVKTRQCLFWIKSNPVPQARKVAFMSAVELAYWGTKETTERRYACVSEDTECLTDRGWKKYFEIKLNDRIATFNLLTEAIEFHYPNAIVSYDFEGELLQIKNKEIDCLVTDNHRMLVRKPYQKLDDWFFIEASKLEGRHFDVPVAGYSLGENIELSDSFLKLLGWIITEGHIERKNKGITISQSWSVHKDYCNEIEECLKTEKIKFSKWISNAKYKDKIKQQMTFRIFAEDALKFKYWIQRKDELLRLPYNRLKILFESLIKGDGTRRKLAHFADASFCFIQKDKEIVDWFVRLCVLIGFRTKVSFRKERGIYYVYISQRNYTRFRKNLIKKRIKYKGRVWCPSVPNSCFVARRNNTIFITGNTFNYQLGQHPDYIITPICSGKERYQFGFHPTQKPEKVIEWIMSYLSNEGDIVLDPFVGSGTTAVVAKKLKRNYIGIEKESKYVKMAEARINAIQKSLL